MTIADSCEQPVHWPSLTADEAAEEWDLLRMWVEQLLSRYPSSARLPSCWWRHNEFVEALSALRDHERACFAQDASRGGAIEWQRARRDIMDCLDAWSKRLSCAVAGRGHSIAAADLDPPAGWREHVEADVERRRARALDHTDR